MSDDLAQKQIVAVGKAMNGQSNSHSTATLPPEVMLKAMEFAKDTGQPLDVVLQVLRTSVFAAE